MVKREIYLVQANIVDANGTYSALSGYPKLFDSKNYDNDVEKALNRARAEYHEVVGAFYKRDDRQLQYAGIMHVNTGAQIEATVIGAVADLPDPEPDEQA